MAPQFVVTPWRDATELLTVRRDLFAADDDVARERAVNKIIAWRARKLELPLLLESTADIVEAKLRDGKHGVPSHALRLVYATAISRFVTGLLDTQTDLARLSLPSQSTPQFPVSLRETRHRIVHRHLPSLAELKRAANESLEWLWEHYWSHLDALLAPAASAQQLDEREVKERLQGVLKSYVKERKAEIKSRRKDARAADNAVGSWFGIGAAGSVKGKVLVHLLVAERNILPVAKKLGSSMEGAYLIWAPFVTALGTIDSMFLQTLTERMINVLSSPEHSMGRVEDDPAREGMCAWVVSMFGPAEQESREHSRRKLLDDVLGLCLMTPTFWTLKLAEELLKDGSVPGRKSWLAILEAAKEDIDEDDEDDEAHVLPPRPETSPDEMEVDDIESGLPVSESSSEAKQIRGPQKYLGLWRPRPIGWVPPGWSEDE
ncbi:Las1-domain-containing protein, partial [Karstenula rhodostoma CBS 690.94]